MHTKRFFLRRSFAGRPMERPLHTIRTLAGVLLIIINASISSPAAASPPQDLPTKTDGEALLLFKKSIRKDPNGVLKGWKPGTDHCRWSGVSCSSGRVAKLDLPRAGLAAGDSRADSIAALSALDMLTFLDLSDNELLINASSLLRLSPALKQLDLAGAGVSGAVPDGLLSKFPGVAYVDLSHNNLSGLLPDDVLLGADELQILDLSYNNLSGDVSGLYTANSCKSLLKFDVSVNSFVGSIPSSLSNCQRLKNLNLAYNDFAGAIPSSFTSFNGLQQLDLSNNHLSGEIPADIGDSCGSLVQLLLSDNNISGGIPLSFSSCSSLVVLDLANNNISGDFPDSILGRLSSLQKLLVSNNFISGPLPLSLSQSKTLKIADFSSNKLSGRLPAGICPGASSLEELRAPDNLISGEIPGELTLCSQLKTIDLSINNLTGAIPPELGRLANLENLMVWFNGLTGGIPPELGRSSKLRNLILNNNFLTGAIPAELFRCRNLEWISLTSNRLAGAISPAFGTLSRLAILQLANNSLTGDIPVELGNCSSLVWLDLNSNRLTGRIPARLGRQPGNETPTGILSGNTIAFVRNVGCKSVGGLLEFAGIKPERLLQVPALKPCDFTRLYSGAALTDWSHFESLEYLDLSYNGLEGGIPPEFGDMAVLQVLDLAHNRLTGEIPDTIGKLSNLGVFDASHNRLRGTIPDSFSNLSFLVQIDFSDNSLTGPIPSRGQLSTLPASQFANNPGLCGVPLPPCGTTPSPSSTATATTASTSRRQVAWANSTIVLGVMATLAVLCIVAVWGIAVRARRREKRTARMLGSLAAGGRAATTWKLGREREPLSINVATFQRQLRKLTFSALIEATNGFSADSLVGSGGFGEVFRATLKDGSSVAVKKLVRLSCQGDREFTAEMETLGKIKHRNLVPLLGYCKVGEERLLVYEFMHFGSLEEMLHGQNKTRALTWDERKKIARGAAKGLCFLHHNCIPHIIHRDMKSSNVLLDKDMEARVSDFGMARLISALDTHLSVSTLAGTPGYVPPEYYQSFRCTAKGDVYSFGVVVLELLTGRRPTEKEEFGDTNLVGWVKGKVREGREREVLDGEVVAAAAAAAAGREVEEMERCLEIAVQCVDDFPSRRPNMLQVVAMLRELVSFPGDGGGDGGGDGVGGD